MYEVFYFDELADLPVKSSREPSRVGKFENDLDAFNLALSLHAISNVPHRITVLLDSVTVCTLLKERTKR